MMMLLEFSVKMMIPISGRENKKKLESHARVDFSEGCKSIMFRKVLGMVFPPWAGFLPKYHVLVRMG